MVYKLLLNLVCYYFTEDFCLNIHRRYQSYRDFDKVDVSKKRGIKKDSTVCDWGNLKNAFECYRDGEVMRLGD